jgi:cytochrome bd-type quinol oxidase subunit 1
MSLSVWSEAGVLPLADVAESNDSIALWVAFVLIIGVIIALIVLAVVLIRRRRSRGSGESADPDEG